MGLSQLYATFKPLHAGRNFPLGSTPGINDSYRQLAEIIDPASNKIPNDDIPL